MKVELKKKKKMAIHIVLNRNQEEGIPRGFEPWQAILDAPFKTNVRAKKKNPYPTDLGAGMPTYVSDFLSLQLDVSDPVRLPYRSLFKKKKIYLNRSIYNKRWSIVSSLPESKL